MHAPVRRRRTSSFFNIEEYNFHVRGKNTAPNLKGNFVVTHSEMPDVSPKLSKTPEIETRHGPMGPIIQNTYQLDPQNLFCPSLVEKILKENLEFLQTADYRPDKARIMSNDLANAIRLRVKPLFPRYKLIVQVTIGGKGQQAIKVASKSFWDTKRDNFASYTVTSPHLFAVATVYGIYFE